MTPTAILKARGGTMLAILLASACSTADLPGAASANDEIAANGGYTATGAELSATDEKGQPRFKLKAGGVTQQQSTQPVQLTAVQLQFPDSRGETWTLTANAGQLSAGGAVPAGETKPSVVDLSGDVRLRGTAGANGVPLELSTATLRYDSSKQLATTRDKVTLKSGERSLQARGMTANLASRRLQLESDVYGRFTP